MAPAAAQYFPYMRIPKDDWFQRVLLYWDEVRLIAPEIVHGDRDLLGGYTSELIDVGLVRPTRPERHAVGEPLFAKRFLSVLPARYERDGRSRTAGSTYTSTRWGSPSPTSCNVGLARPERRGVRGGFYVEVESKTAQLFMSYLALVMANRPEAAAEPVTDDAAALGALADVGQVATEEGSDRDQATGSGDLRMHVLEALLPSPGVPIEPAALAEFKRDNPRLLSSFRAAIDDAVSRTAGYRGETQQLALDVEIRGLRDQLDGIMEQLRVLEWKPVLTTLAALAVGPGAELLAGEVGLAFAGGAAVYAGALELAWAKRDKRVAMRHPLAYAALAQRGFAANGP